jgi:hypothetical protein
LAKSFENVLKSVIFIIFNQSFAASQIYRAVLDESRFDILRNLEGKLFKIFELLADHQILA